MFAKYFRRFSIILALAIFTAGASAQESGFGKGSIIIEGSGSYASIGGDAVEGEDRITFINAGPTILYAISDKIIVGGNLDWTSVAQSGESDNDLCIGPQANYTVSSSGAIVLVGGAASFCPDEGENTNTYSPLVSIYLPVGGRGYFKLQGAYNFSRSDVEGEEDKVSGNRYGVSLGVALIF